MAMLTVMGGCAFVVYEYVGLSILRRGWFDIDCLWAVVLVTASTLTIAVAL